MLSTTALIVACALTASPESPHGPRAPGFSHHFQLAPHLYEHQLNVHFGLTQPLLLRGFNVAVDYRVDRFVFEYSHGVGLNYNATPAIAANFVSPGTSLISPVTTGAGAGLILLDDLYLLVEVKLHQYDVQKGGERASYLTASIGPALAYRLFLWRGLNVTAYARWWPTVWTDAPAALTLGGERHQPVDLQFFGNLSVGWAFDMFPR